MVLDVAPLNGAE